MHDLRRLRRRMQRFGMLRDWRLFFYAMLAMRSELPHPVVLEPIVVSERARERIELLRRRSVRRVPEQDEREAPDV